MTDQQEQPQAAEVKPPPTPLERSKANREKTFAARQAKAARRLTDRHGSEPDEKKPEVKPEEKKPEAEAKPPEPKPEEKPEAKPDEKKPERTTADLDKRYAILERREGKNKARDSALNEREQKVSRAERALADKYGDIDDIKARYEKGEHHAVSKALQRWLGDDFATITQKMARALAGLTPEKLKELEERDAFQREKREFESAKQKAERERQESLTRDKARANVREKCKGHDALKIKNGDDLILRQLERHWSPEAKTFLKDGQPYGWRNAADDVVDEYRGYAEALGFKRPSASIVPENKAETPASTPVAKPEAKPAKGRRSFEERHAEAGRLLARKRGL